MTTYSEILSELRASVTNAKDYIPRLCHAAREEDPTLNEQVIRDRVKTDCIALGLSADYVRDCIPQEFKDKVKSKAGKKGKEKQEEEKEKIELLADGTPAQTKRAEYSPEQPKGQDLKSSESQNEKQKPVEDPRDTEIQFLKDQLQQEKIRTAELQEALKKSEQFKPAAQIERSDDFDEYGTNETKVFEWLGKRDNGVNCYWYPNYGIELFRNRILTQLKNKGVTTFKRLYFEV